VGNRAAAIPDRKVYARFDAGFIERSLDVMDVHSSEQFAGMSCRRENCRHQHGDK
jgi:hypothetical protein